MPDPETDISAASRDYDPGPEGEDADATYDPDEIEASRGRELGLGVGERDLQRQRDPGVAARGDEAERLSPAAAGRDEQPDLEGPDEDDAEAAYDPVELEASGTREQELGGDDQPADDEVERLTPEEIAAADAEADAEEEAEVEAAEEEVRHTAQAYSGMGK